jgi:glutathione S-transferase
MTCIEKGIEYELVPIADVRGEGHAALHPFRRMPVVELDDWTLMIETLAITGRLDEGFSGPSLQPEGHAERTRMRVWMSVCADYLFPDVVKAIPRRRPPTAQELATARIALERAESLMTPGGRFLAGETLTLADLYLAPQISNAQEKAPELLDGLDALLAWAGPIRERESFRRTQYEWPPR